ncbi:hypothetical protein CSV79_08710 [Sporosarcina sp. P13]|uniref:hypothetical protein n=1 Tax=Sporosarcina sp. P13 TaxID=2048263 RepID=UPI000C165890|nr:hypothetical protein [Sporosarcina sp. P13]PIC63991.1 hypothetical protein CSV79_08710 [Sporosarcina sp. P13]
MKILFIAGQAIKSNTSVTMMNIAYIKGLIEAGNSVKVITSKLPDGHIASDNGFELPNTLEVEELNISSSFNALSSKRIGSKRVVFNNLKKVLRKAYNSFSLYGPQKSWIKNVDSFSSDEYYDLIISSSDPKHSHLFAKLLIEKKKVLYGKWIQIWGDPMYIDITRNSKLFNKRFYNEEERLISAADKVIYVSPFTADKQKELFPKYQDKIDYILIPYFTLDDTLPRNVNGNDMIFGYFGDYNSKVRNLKPLYNAAIKSKTKLTIRGNSDKPLTKKTDIDISGRISIKELNELEKKTDVFIHLCNTNGTQIPAKVYYYSGTKKPILFILDGESKKIKSFFEKYKRFVFCENNREDIIKAINEIKSRKFSEVKNEVLDELSPVSIANDLLRKVGGDKFNE